jgi:hypothetical protein
MSIWFRRKDEKTGRVWYVSIGVPLLPVIAVAGILLALLLPLVQACRQMVR